MIILEGPDNVGKTVAAKKLVGMVPGGHYVHYSKPPDGFDYWFDYLKDLNPGVVLDRFHLGAIAYGTILGGHEHTVSRVQWACLMRMLRYMGAMTVIMYDSNEESYCKRVAGTTREEMYSAEKQKIVNRVYRTLATAHIETGVPYCDLRYDLAEHGFPTDETLQSWIDAQKDMA